MKNVLMFAVAAAVVSVSSISLAEESSPSHRNVGLDFQLGVPAGLSVGAVISPYFNWLKVNGDFSTNYFCQGWGVGMTVDPIPFAIGLTGTLEAGHMYGCDVTQVAHKQLPTFDYGYQSALLGLEFGGSSRRNNRFSFFLRGGATWLQVDTDNIDRVFTSNDVTMSNPHIHGVVPSAKLGFNWMVW